ncbi:MAG: S41 family peptidase [Polaribacter sp.]
MRQLLTLLLFFINCISFAQSNKIDTYKFSQDFGQIIQDLSDNYIYLKDKKTDFNCVMEKYSKVFSKVRTKQEKVLFFEYLLDEFYDSQLILNTATKSSFRLHSPIYVAFRDGKFFIQNIWSSQMKSFGNNIIGAEVINFNSKDFNNVIDNFPTQCSNKSVSEVREWIANKVLAGRYNEPRILTLKLVDGRKISLDVDDIKVKKENSLLSVSKKNGIAIIKINNSLGNKNLIRHFDNKLNSVLDSKGLILDLRNTADIGSSYNARAILSRFIKSELPYQKHITKEKYGNNPEIIKSRLEYVSPRGIQYKQPVVVLVGRWTGSVGETIAIGLDGMNRAKIVGTEMEKLAGSVKDYSFKNRNYGYTISTDKLYHINGYKREDFIPEFYISQRNNLNDIVLNTALGLFKIKTNSNFVTRESETNNTVVSKLD